MDKSSFTSAEASGCTPETARIVDNEVRRAGLISIESLSHACAVHHTLMDRMHTHNHYSVVWFFEGEGTFVSNFQCHPIEPQSLFFTSPARLHQCLMGQHGESVVVNFSEELLRRAGRNIERIVRHKLFPPLSSSAPVCKLDAKHVATLENDVNRLHEMVSTPVNKALLADYLSLLLSYFLLDIITYGRWETMLGKANTQAFQVYTRFLELVEQHFKTQHHAETYAEQLGLSPGTLGRCVGEVSGLSPAWFVRTRIVNEAKRMMYDNRQIHIKTVAQMLGFDDCSNFVKFFKRYAGQSPITFKEQLDRLPSVAHDCTLEKAQ